MVPFDCDCKIMLSSTIAMQKTPASVQRKRGWTWRSASTFRSSVPFASKEVSKASRRDTNVGGLSYVDVRRKWMLNLSQSSNLSHGILDSSSVG